jgi:hypothetical protein
LDIRKTSHSVKAARFGTSAVTWRPWNEKGGDFLKCDFCSSPAVEVVYPAESSRMFIFDGQDLKGIGDSIGGWVACAVCARLIDAKDREGLAKRSAETMPDLGAGGLSPEKMVLVISTIQREMFWGHSKGPGIRFSGFN